MTGFDLFTMKTRMAMERARRVISVYSASLHHLLQIDFPILARAAVVVLAITPSSAEVERLFSKSGLVVTKKRSNLISLHINILVTLDCWLLHTLMDPLQ